MDVFKQAAAMKEAALKDKPERRAWEEAAPFFKWTCGDYEAVHAARARNDAADRLEAAVQFRHAGNEKFAQEEFDDALMQYSHAIAVFVHFQRAADRSVDTVKLVDTVADLPAAARPQVHAHLAAAFLNAAAVHARRGEHEHVIYACTKALSYDPRSSKALFRRAQATYALGTTVHLEAAVADLRRARQIDPKNDAVAAALRGWQRELREQNTRDRRTFGHMFERGDIYPERTVHGAGDKGAESLGWLQPPFTEQARKEAQEMGVDLDDPAVQAQLRAFHEERQQPPAPSGGTGDGGAVPRGVATTKKNPKTFLEWWQLLFTGRLRWRWHYLCYAALWLHAVWRTFCIITAAQGAGAAEAHAQRSTAHDDF